MSDRLLGGIGTGELLVILFIVLLLFGGRKLPELARSLGRAVREYQKAMSGASEEASEEETKGKAQTDEELRKAILETAKKLGIETEGRSLKEIMLDISKAEEMKK
ncbi:MAG: twin-arginine translocase TatA/TatE family subunit [Candidatus Bathyarchaeia archaeon]